MVSIKQQFKALSKLPKATIKAIKARNNAIKLASDSRGAEMMKAKKDAGGFMPPDMLEEFAANDYVIKQYIKKLKKK